MQILHVIFGLIFIGLGLVYVLAPEKIFKYDEMRLFGRTKKKSKMTKEWREGALVKGIFFILGGLLVLFLEEILAWLYPL